MDIRSVVQFLEYWDSLRSRTRRVVTCIPPERLEWTHRVGAFTLGDLVRHLATIERHMYAEAKAIIGALTDADLQRKCQTPAGTAITTWKWLRAMCEHEAHHRGQIYLMLGMLEVATPPLYGLTSEEVRARSA